ncbi:MAG: histidine ammonia-lyase [Actinobacteria bacterium]|nr:MAG: histidine ammonia-lyase [Actinomycetota bacterium]
MTILIGERLDRADVAAVARGASVELSPGARGRLQASRDVVASKVEAGETVYGVTTGLGSLASVRLQPDEVRRLQLDLLRSHAVGVGPALSREEVRTMLLLRAHVLALGYSGVRPVVVERLMRLLNEDLLPIVPEQGSLGASGDLAPLAHLALPLIGEGEIQVNGQRVPAGDALRAAGIEPLELEPKEGLALINGTQGMLAVGLVAADRARALARTADITAAMTIEAILGTDRPFDERLHRLRPHPGQLASAANLRALLAGSEITASHRNSAHLVQDAYSLRCAPQVHGAFRDALGHADSVLEIEVGAVSDNPIVFAETGEVVSGGNFHGQPVAVALDALAVATVGLASISERRLYRLLDPATNNGLPAFLVDKAGMNSGFMIVQYTAASLVSESKTLAHPASVDSIPSSAGQEDHVSMGMTAARHARGCVANAEVVVAMEVLCSAQALELRALTPAPATRAALAAVREVIAFLREDRGLKADVDAAIELVRSGALLEAVGAVTGPLV